MTQLTSDLRRPITFQAQQVLRVGANFSGNVSQYADAFDKLVDEANTRITTLNQSAQRESGYKDVLAWINVPFTVLVTLLAAIAGVNPQEQPNFCRCCQTEQAGHRHCNHCGTGLGVTTLY